MPEIELYPSPNFGPRRGGARPDMAVLHYTGMATAAEAIARLADPASEVSAHYVIDLDGRAVAMVAEEMRAWHAGVAHWAGEGDVNSRSIGIELVNPGHELGYPPFPEPQMAGLEALLATIMSRHAIPPERVVGHACVAPARKRDPGKKLDWRRLARRGLSIWLDPEPDEAGAGGPTAGADAGRFQSAARAFGYAVPESDEWCPATLAVWQAWLARFWPARAGEAPFAAGVRHLERLARRWPARGTEPQS